MTKVITICGSSRFIEVMAVVGWLLERDEGAIVMGLHLLPSWYCKDLVPHHLAEHEGIADKMDELHLRKIDISDEVFVVNCSGYVGKSTAREVKYAGTLEKTIRWYTDDTIGRRTALIVEGAILRGNEEPTSWKPVNNTDSPEQAHWFLGYSPEWVDDDFNPQGIRECISLDVGETRFYLSAKWNNDLDCWDTEETTVPTFWMDIPKGPVKRGEPFQSPDSDGGL